jgi:anti-sigma regulatory factor (Ser/Thr protein kinase)
LAPPARLETLPALRTLLRSWLAEQGVEDVAAQDILLATWEACANAVEHPCGARRSAYDLEVRAGPDGVRVTVRDSGSWRRPDDSVQFRGLGLRLVDGLMDDVSIRPTSHGTEIVMRRTVEGSR